MTVAIRQLSDRRMKEIFGEGAFEGDVFVNEVMKDHTTLKIGGPADIFAIPKTMLSLKNLVMALRDEELPSMPMGGGSNILVSESGIPGVVISTVFLHHIETIEEGADEVRLFVEAGVPLQKLVNLTKARGYRGMEGLAGIPGFLGGALQGNAGSFGFAIGNVVESVTVIQGDGKICTLERDALGFGYRSSTIPEETAIVSANIRLRKGDAMEVSKSAHEFLQEKLRKQPVSQRSAGCVFKNPSGSHAGRLIDEAGCKGMRKGDVEVSTLHANFFINRGGGNAVDFMGLMDEVRERVMKSFCIELEPEIKIVGRFSNGR